MSQSILVLDANNARQTVQLGALPEGAATAARQDSIIALLTAAVSALEDRAGLQMRLSLTGLAGGGAGNLDGIDTAGRAPGLIVGAVIGGQLGFWQLQAGSDAASPPGVVRPADYDAGTPKIWKKVL